MIERIYSLIDALAVLVCLHQLYGKKFRLDILTVSFLSIDMIIMTTIIYYELPKVYSLIIYPIIMIYCGIKFGFKWREIIINSILYLIILGGIQIILIICYGCVFNLLFSDIVAFQNKELLAANVGVLLITTVILPKLRIHRLSCYLQNKDRFLVVFVAFCIIVITPSVVKYKVINRLGTYRNFTLFVGVVLFCILVGQLSKYKIKSKEAETELKIQQLYSDSFHSLIEDIRIRQHEFDNHINAIYSLQYTCESYEELVKAQNEYSNAIVKENRYNKLLKPGNPLLIGFLYGKFVEIEKLGIEISYQISIDELKVAEIPDYKIVEILGNLIKNAVEAMANQNNLKKLYVGIREIEGVFEIEVRNRSEFIDYSQIEMFFRKGFTKKGINRGLGLYNVKNICDEYSLKIYCENKVENEENWLCFIISNVKETI